MNARAGSIVVGGVIAAALLGAGACSSRAPGCTETRSCASTGDEEPTARGAAATAGEAFDSDEPDVSPLVTACDPVTEDCTDGALLYVSPFGTEGGRGTKEDPVNTLGRGLELAVLENEPGKSVSLRVCSTGGNYGEDIVLGPEHAGVAIVGGYSCADFSRTGDLTVVDATSSGGHSIRRASGVLLADLILRAPDAEAVGESSVALRIVETHGLRVVRSDLRAGAGASGASGLGHEGSADSGEDGQDGADACTSAESNVGSASVVTVCGGAITQSSSGVGGCEGCGDAGAGAPVTLGGGTPGGWEGESCSAAEPGAPGVAGEHGAAAERMGSLDASGYTPSVGAPGVAGGVGQGGGGGGGGRRGNCSGANQNSSGGGSGGSGGCGGRGGGGGQSGGGSFAVLALRSSLELDEVILRVEAGGDGGAGGDRELGGVGGSLGEGGAAAPGSQPEGTWGCDGGAGGPGGAGGSGGGGAGGPSVGVGTQDSVVILRASTVVLPSAAAPGALGGVENEDAAGESGLVTEQYEF